MSTSCTNQFILILPIDVSSLISSNFAFISFKAFRSPSEESFICIGCEYDSSISAESDSAKYFNYKIK